MKKKVFGRQLSRERDSRRALYRSLVRALTFNGKIVTTKAKAKAVQGEVEGLVTLAKDGSVAAKRKVYSVTGNDRSVADFIFKTIVPAFSEKRSGFTKITNLPRRKGDRAKIVRLEWGVEIERKDAGSKGKRSKKLIEKKGEKEKSPEKGKLTSRIKKALSSKK
jgi:large subunit ribosomal protein L17